jgi:hypothetical protein
MKKINLFYKFETLVIGTIIALLILIEIAVHI